MAGSASNYLEDALLNATLRNTTYTSPATVYVGLFTTNPTDSAPGTEVTTSGTAYARQAVTFGAPSSGACSNSVAVTFAVATANYGTVEGFGIFDNVSAGNMLYWCDSPSVPVNSGQQASFAIGALVVSAD